MREENTNKPFITVGIASYNYARFLPRAFEAIRRQKFTDFEVLYCDDGSTDDSVAVIERFIQENPEMRIRLICGKNAGVMENKNRILENAAGEYVMLCDADDWMDDDCLQVLAQAAQKTDADRVVSEIRNVDDEGRALKHQTLPANPSKWAEVLHHGALYKLSVIQQHNLCFTQRIPDDFCFIERFNLYANKTEFVHREVYNWLIHNDSTSRVGGTENSWKGGQIFEGIVQQSVEILPLIDRENDRLQLEAEVIKNYYFHLISGVASLHSITQIKELYRNMREQMCACVPQYLTNPYISGQRPSLFRRETASVLRILCLADRLHLIPLLLLVFWCAGKTNLLHAETM